MSDGFHGNPMFQQKRDVTDEERAQMDALAEEFLLSMFQTVNKRFNALGLCLTIGAIRGEAN